MDRIEIGLEKAYLGWDVNAHLYDETGKCMKSVPKNTKEIASRKIAMLWQEYRRRKHPFIDQEKDVCYLVFFSVKYLIVLGPVFIPGYNRKKGMQNIPILFPKKAAACLSTISYLVTGNYDSEKKLLEPLRNLDEDSDMQEEHPQKTFLLYSEEDSERYQYDTELQWTSLIERGELNRQAVDMKQTQSDLYAVGVLSQKGDSKQAEYMMVCAITLASRAAIRGGVDSYKAYQFSDWYLQRLSSAETVQKVMCIGLEAVNAFNDLVKERLKNNSGNIYCEKAKNYIGRHLREKIRIVDIAATLGLNSSYLTNVFSREEGMPMKAYIMQEKLKLAANLLKNTDQNIGFISDYLSFNSQSYFSSCFRKEYGMMPSDYRQKYKIYYDVADKI